MGTHHFGVWILLLTCLFFVLSWYGKNKVNAKTLDNYNTSEENEFEVKYDGQQTKKTVKKLRQINMDRKKSHKGKQNGKTKNNGKTKKKGNKGKGKINGDQKNDKDKNPDTSSTNSVEDLEGFLVEGDMILNKNQLEQFINEGGVIGKDLDVVNKNETHNNQTGHRNAMTDKYYHWPLRKVYYSFDQSVSPSEKQLIRTTLANLEKKIAGCLSFVQSSQYNRNKIMVTTTKSNIAGRCQSHYGYQHRRDQKLELSKPSCWKTGTIEHEFLHAIGIYHAHVRSDRDKYVTIKDENIEPNRKENFENMNYKMSHHNLPYDYYSVMHYSKKGFSKNGQITIKTMDPSKQDAIGQKVGVSLGDIQLIQQMYGCSVEVTYGRCYDSKSRSLPHVINAGTKNSVNYCQTHCYDAGFRYAGVEAGDQCLCGDYLPSNSLKKPSTDCSIPCPADKTQFCGAVGRYNVFRTNTDFVDGTCYEARNPIYKYRSDTMTPDECMERCFNSGYAFAGVRYHDRCFCGGDPPPYNRIKDSSECNANCKGDKSKKCGGSYRISVYRSESLAYLESKSYLYSPNYPDNYPNQQDKLQTISVRQEHFIKISFNNFKIEDHKTCDYDYVQFYDGNKKKHGIFCGDTKPPNFIIPSHKAYIKFVSDISERRQGYKLSYQAVKLPGDHQETPYFDLDGGDWGDWGYPQKCRYPHFVTKMDLKIEYKQASGDNTALNAIRLTCSNGQTITSVQGGEGRWRGVQSCPSENFMYSAQIRRQSHHYGDNTAANGVRFSCTDTTHSTPRPLRYPGNGYWGSWSSSSSCGKGNAVIGLATQVERDQGSGDDTGLNDVRFYCAKLPHIQIIYPGSNSVRSRTRINLEETKEKKIPEMNSTQTTVDVDDTKTGRIAN